MSRPNPQVTVTGRHVGESAKAVRFIIHTVSGFDLEKPQAEWFPLSQITKIHKSPDTTAERPEDYIVCSEWICKQKKLIGEGDLE